MGFELDGKRSVLNYYGVRTTNGKFGGQQSTKNGIIKSAVWDFDYNDLPSQGSTGLQLSIPANATIVSAKLYVDVAFTSTSTTTDLDVGLYQAGGTVIDADGLITVAEATQTAIGTAGNVVTGAGALVGKTIGAAAGELKVAPSVDDLTAGAGRIVVEYIYNKD
jgi:hypothetical protein